MTVRRLFRSRHGSAALEFSVIAPVIAIIFAGTADIGAVLLKQFQLDNTLSSAANYALISEASVSAANGAALAASLATIVSGSGTSVYADSLVVVNNGPRRQVVGGVAT